MSRTRLASPPARCTWRPAATPNRKAGRSLLCTALIVPTREGHESSLPVHREYNPEVT